MKRNFKKRLFPLLLAAMFLSGCGAKPEAEEPAQEEAPQPPVEEVVPEPTEIVSTLAVCGDTMSHMPITNDAWNEETGIYEYSRIMAAAEPYLSAADCAVTNLETTLSGGPKYSGFPAFNSPDDLARELKKVGFDLVLTANNHSLDKRNPGVMRTLDVLDETGLAHVGTSRTQEEYENNVQVMDVGGISVAFLGYTYGTNGIPLPTDAPYAVNVYNTDYLTTLTTIDREKVLADLEKAETLGTDLIAAMVHWGVEYQTKQNRYQEEMADLLLQHGADLVLGGHAHVPQPMEMRTVTLADGTEKTGFVCYSLGNFISSQNDPLTDTTAVLTLELTKDLTTNTTQVTDVFYRPMLMLDREGGKNRYELLDAYALLESGVTEPGVEEKLQKAVADCREIFGEEYDAALR